MGAKFFNHSQNDLRRVLAYREGTRLAGFDQTLKHLIKHSPPPPTLLAPHRGLGAATAWCGSGSPELEGVVVGDGADEVAVRVVAYGDGLALVHLFRVWGFGFTVRGLRFTVYGLSFRVGVQGFRR